MIPPELANSAHAPSRPKIASMMLVDPDTGEPMPLWTFPNSTIFGVVFGEVISERLRHGWPLRGWPW